jgi:hypothetical protein
MHPAVSGGGEVTHICPDAFHDGDPVTEKARAFFAERAPPSGALVMPSADGSAVSRP